MHGQRPAADDGIRRGGLPHGNMREGEGRKKDIGDSCSTMCSTITRQRLMGGDQAIRTSQGTGRKNKESHEAWPRSIHTHDQGDDKEEGTWLGVYSPCYCT